MVGEGQGDGTLQSGKLQSFVFVYAFSLHSCGRIMRGALLVWRQNLEVDTHSWGRNAVYEQRGDTGTKISISSNVFTVLVSNFHGIAVELKQSCSGSLANCDPGI